MFLQNLISNTYAIVRSLSITESDSAFTILPPHYTYGLSVINMLVHKGGTIYVTDHSTIQSQFHELQDFYKPSIFTGVPYHFEIEN